MKHADKARIDCLNSLRYCESFWPKVESFKEMIGRDNPRLVLLACGRLPPPPTHTHAPVIYMHENNTKLNEIF